MKKQSIQSRLQQQYNRLNKRLQRAIKNGKFEFFSAFRKAQMLFRLNGYAKQLKKLGVSVAVCAGIGLATPALGQGVGFVERTGSANAFDAIDEKLNPTFVDIDGDGDLDMFEANDSLGGGFFQPIDYYITYYENTGTANNPIFTQQTNNPIPSSISATSIEFADIDNDGDYDAFATGKEDPMGASAKTFYYLENTGSAINPNFVERTGSQNPLDTINQIFVSVPSQSNQNSRLGIADLDNDNDFDFWFIERKDSLVHKYLENTGTASSPNFEVRPFSSDPLSFLQDANWGAQMHLNNLQFVDMDIDGDLDVYGLIDTNASPSTVEPYVVYYENTGTVAAPSFGMMPSTTTPFDHITDLDEFLHYELVDLDGDTDLDIVFRRKQPIASDEVFYYENQRITSLTNIEGIKTITTYPNPAKSKLYLEENLTGTVRFVDVTGKECYTTSLWDEQTIDVSTLNNGIYFMLIETNEEKYRQKVVIQQEQ